MAYTVTAAACTVFLANGAATLLYKGATLPAASEMREGEGKRLKDGGFVETVKAVEPASQKAPTAAEKKAAEKAAAEQAAADKAAAEKAAADAAAQSGS